MVMGAHMGNLSPAAPQTRCRRILLHSPIQTLQNRTEGFEDLLLMTVPCRAVWAMRSWLAPLVNRRKASVWALKGLHYLANAFAAEGTLCVRRKALSACESINRPQGSRARTYAAAGTTGSSRRGSRSSPARKPGCALHAAMPYCAACSKPRTWWPLQSSTNPPAADSKPSKSHARTHASAVTGPANSRTAG